MVTLINDEVSKVKMNYNLIFAMLCALLIIVALSFQIWVS